MDCDCCCRLRQLIIVENTGGLAAYASFTQKNTKYYELWMINSYSQNRKSFADQNHIRNDCVFGRELDRP